jgi:hypothetical protein
MKWWPTKTRKPNTEAVNQPSPPPGDDRDIFTFWDGTAHRKVDPLPIWYALWQTPDIQQTLQRAANAELEATSELIVLCRRLLSIPVYDETKDAGLTELQVVGVFSKFIAFCDELKKKVGPLPMPWQMLAPKASSDPSTTPPAAASSCSPAESPSVEPSTTSTPLPPPSTTP